MRIRVIFLLSCLVLLSGLSVAQDARLLKAQDKIDRLRAKVDDLAANARRADSAVEAARNMIRMAEDSLRILGAEEESIKRAQFDAEKRARKDVNNASETALDSLRSEYRNIEREIDARIRDLDRRGKSAQRFYENGLKNERRAKEMAKKAHTDKKNAEKAVERAQEDYVKLQKSINEKQQKAQERQQKRGNNAKKHVNKNASAVRIDAEIIY